MSVIIDPQAPGASAAPASDVIKDGDTRSFTADVIEASMQTPVIVDFWAPWCGPCKMMAPAFEQAATLLEPDFRLLKVNTEQEQGLAARFGIRSIPTLMVLAGGREVGRMAGAMDAAGIVAWARQPHR